MIHIGRAVLTLNGSLDYFIDNAFDYPTLTKSTTASPRLPAPDRDHCVKFSLTQSVGFLHIVVQRRQRFDRGGLHRRVLEFRQIRPKESPHEIFLD